MRGDVRHPHFTAHHRGGGEERPERAVVPGHEKLGAGIPHEPFRLPRCPKGRFAEVAALRKRCPAGSKATRARERWPQIERIDTRYRAGFAYVDTHLADGETLRLCRLRYTGYAK